MTPSPATLPQQPDNAPTEALYIDVRSPAEYAMGHLEGALNIPLDQLPTRIGASAPDRGRELVLYCASGARSGHGCALLAQLGYAQVRNAGGLGSASLSSQRPVRRG